MSDLLVTRNVSPDYIREWRAAARRRARGNRRLYGVSPGVVAQAPEVEANDKGQVELGVPALGAKRTGRELADIMTQRRLDTLDRLRSKDPAAILDMVRHFRLAYPGLLAKWPDTNEGNNEAAKHLVDIFRQEAEQTAKRALIRDGRDATLIYGR